MSVQIAVRLSEEAVAYLDAQVRSGRARSRADVVNRALARDARRERAGRDLEVILADRAAAQPGEFDSLAQRSLAARLELD